MPFIAILGDPGTVGGMSTNTNRNGFAADYVDVATRIIEFRTKHPEGCLRPYDPAEPVKVVVVGDKTYLQYVACAYRHPADPAPGIGVAWEPFPGRTPFTRDSEAMVAETSAWGRAIVAAMAADTKHGVASKDEVTAARNRKAETPAPVAPVSQKLCSAEQVKKIGILRKELELDESAYRDRLGRLYGVPSAKDLTVAQASDLIEKLSDALTRKAAS